MDNFEKNFFKFKATIEMTNLIEDIKSYVGKDLKDVGIIASIMDKDIGAPKTFACGNGFDCMVALASTITQLSKSIDMSPKELITELENMIKKVGLYE